MNFNGEVAAWWGIYIYLIKKKTQVLNFIKYVIQFTSSTILQKYMEFILMLTLGQFNLTLEINCLEKVTPL